MEGRLEGVNDRFLPTKPNSETNRIKSTDTSPSNYDKLITIFVLCNLATALSEKRCEDKADKFVMKIESII